MEITLKSGKKIGLGHPPYIIAEVGSNWQTLEDCLYSVRQAKGVGADAVKFQAYSHEALYGRPGDMSGSLPPAWLPRLKSEAVKAGIDFMCSAFSPELVSSVNPYVDVHKVASAELSHVRILERVRDSGKPVFLSTGASGEEDIRRALEVLDGSQVVLFYCVASYPARFVDLSQIRALRETHGKLVGYSDHTTDVIQIPGAAHFEHQACVIEKHVTFIGAKTPDSPHSLTGAEFQRMADYLKNRTLPNYRTNSPFERGMVMRHNRRLIATSDIGPGETLLEGKNFGIYRSLQDDTHAFSPFMIAKVHGRTATRAILAGDGIGPGDIE